jgi:hypothetical protein
MEELTWSKTVGCGFRREVDGKCRGQVLKKGSGWEVSRAGSVFVT